MPIPVGNSGTETLDNQETNNESTTCKGAHGEECISNPNSVINFRLITWDEVRHEAKQEDEKGMLKNIQRPNQEASPGKQPK
mmetsp:Transcript_82335/g.145536  ORF Transcript_82335/g.145536 Transcript_82335/m.145536 type:complete len:82 (-) Transcript_82335:44-289(-)